MDTLTKFLVTNPSLAVALTLGTVAVASALLMLIATLWIRPKVSAIDSLADRVTQLETRISSFPDFHALIALVTNLTEHCKARIERAMRSSKTQSSDWNLFTSGVSVK